MKKVLVISYWDNGKCREFEIDPRDIKQFLACMDDAIDADLSSLTVKPLYRGDNKEYKYNDWCTTW